MVLFSVHLHIVSLPKDQKFNTSKLMVSDLTSSLNYFYFLVLKKKKYVVKLTTVTYIFSIII